MKIDIPLNNLNVYTCTNIDRYITVPT